MGGEQLSKKKFFFSVFVAFPKFNRSAHALPVNNLIYFYILDNYRVAGSKLTPLMECSAVATLYDDLEFFFILLFFYFGLVLCVSYWPHSFTNCRASANYAN